MSIGILGFFLRSEGAAMFNSVQFVRDLCKERKIAINKLATMSDVKQSTLDNIVRGLTKNPRVKRLSEPQEDNQDFL